MRKQIHRKTWYFVVTVTNDQHAKGSVVSTTDPQDLPFLQMTAKEISRKAYKAAQYGGKAALTAKGV